MPTSLNRKYGGSYTYNDKLGATPNEQCTNIHCPQPVPRRKATKRRALHYSPGKAKSIFISSINSSISSQIFEDSSDLFPPIQPIQQRHRANLIRVSNSDRIMHQVGVLDASRFSFLPNGSPVVKQGRGRRKRRPAPLVLDKELPPLPPQNADGDRQEATQKQENSLKGLSDTSRIDRNVISPLGPAFSPRLKSVSPTSESGQSQTLGKSQATLVHLTPIPAATTTKDNSSNSHGNNNNNNRNSPESTPQLSSPFFSSPEDNIAEYFTPSRDSSEITIKRDQQHKSQQSNCSAASSTATSATTVTETDPKRIATIGVAKLAKLTNLHNAASTTVIATRTVTSTPNSRIVIPGPTSTIFSATPTSQVIYSARTSIKGLETPSSSSAGAKSPKTPEVSDFTDNVLMRIKPHCGSLPPTRKSDTIRHRSSNTVDTSITSASEDSILRELKLHALKSSSHNRTLSSSTSSICSIDAIDSLLRSNMGPKLEAFSVEEQSRIHKKFSLVRELVETEKSFATDMGVIIDIYYSALRSDKYFGYVCRTDLLKLFSNVDQILLLSRQLVICFREVIPAYVFETKSAPKNHLLADVDTKVASVFLDFVPAIEAAFQAYCDTNKIQMETFYRIRALACPKIDEWLSECLEKSKLLTNAWTLDALLIKPVQRLLKYPLLLSGLIKVTPESHPEYLPLRQALSLMEEAAEHINKNTTGAADSNHKVETSSNRRKSKTGSTSNLNFSASSATTKRHISAGSYVGSDYLDDAYAEELNNLKDDCSADHTLEVLLKAFDMKKKSLQNLIQAVTNDVATIQQHFSSNSSLAKAWLTWAMTSSADGISSVDESLAPKLKRYKHYALFSSPFTASSSTQLSTSQLYRRINKEVLRPLDKVRAMYERTHLVSRDRRRYHEAYAQYVKSKSEYSYAAPSHTSFSAVEQKCADLFVKYHNSLKDGLPDLFRLTDRMIGLALSRYVSIEKDWFRIAVDSMATVFNISMDDISPAPESTEDKNPIVDSFRERSSKGRQSLLNLGLCRESSGRDKGKETDDASDNCNPNPIGNERKIRNAAFSVIDSEGEEDDEFIEGQDLMVRIRQSKTVDEIPRASNKPPSASKMRRKNSLLSLSGWQKKSIRQSPSRYLSS